MKKANLFLAMFFIAAAIFSACGKTASTAKTTQQKIQAKWNLQTEYDHQFYAGYNTYDTITGAAEDYFDFRTDGKAYYKAGSNMDTATYVLSGDDKIITYSLEAGVPVTDTIFIQSLTDNSLQLYSKYYDPYPDFSEYTIYLTK